MGRRLGARREVVGEGARVRIGAEAAFGLAGRGGAGLGPGWTGWRLDWAFAVGGRVRAGEERSRWCGIAMGGGWAGFVCARAEIVREKRRRPAERGPGFARARGGRMRAGPGAMARSR